MKRILAVITGLIFALTGLWPQALNTVEAPYIIADTAFQGPGSGITGFAPGLTTGDSAAVFSALASTAAGQGAALVGTLGTATGEVARTQAQKNSDWKSVKDFGALGDGIADDTAAIQKALNWLASSTQLGLIFPYGIYSVSQIVLMNPFKAKIQFHGAIIAGNSNAGLDSIFEIVNSVSCDYYGSWEILNYSNYNYGCGLSFQASIASGFTCTCTTTTLTLVSAPQIGALTTGVTVAIPGNGYTALGTLVSGTANNPGAVYNISGNSSGWTTVATASLGYSCYNNAASTRNNICNLTVRNCQTGIKQGQYNVDSQNSECVYHGCNFFSCPNPFWGAGSQTGASFMGCNICSEYNAAYAGATLIAFKAEGGFWYVNGGELTQESTVGGSCILVANPAQSSVAAFACPYPIFKVSNAHIESSGILVYLYNPRAIPSPYGAASSITFSNTGGYVSPGDNLWMIDTSADATAAIKIVFNNGCLFYQGSGAAQRATPSFNLGAANILDIDGQPFSSTFYQGLSALYPSGQGKPRLRGETILSRYSSVTSVAAATFTVINFTADNGTANGGADGLSTSCGYGASHYSAGSFTVPQNLKDVVINWNIYFATVPPNATVAVFVNGVNTNFYGTQSGNINTGYVVLPAVAAGVVITLQAMAGGASPILLSGAAGNAMNISAHT